MNHLPVRELDVFSGNYEGSGAWIDIAGESKKYSVAQRIDVDGNKMKVVYTHDFYQENSKTSGEFVFEFSSETIFKVNMGGKTVGNGYVFGRYLHYHIQFGEVYVEVSYQADGEAILAHGSSTKNSQGNYIAWFESLKKQRTA